VGPHSGLPVVIAGFSQGAALAIWLILAGRIPSNRFIAVNPGFVTSPRLDPLLAAAASRHVTGRVIVGELDADLAEAARLHAGMTSAGLDVGLTTLAGLGHDMPRPFGPHLVRILDDLGVP
jgi:predicted esterase